MNFDVDTWPDLLARELGEMVTIMLFAWLLIGVASVFSIIITIFKVEFFHDSFAKNFPFAASILDTMIWGMRAVAFGMLGLFILFFMFDDDVDMVMFVLIPQLMLMSCVVFLLTEILRIMIHGADKVPKLTR